MSKESDAARALGKARWAGTTKAERVKALAAVSAKRSKRKLVAHARRIAKLPKSISPEAARARALKAWETKRKKAEAAGK